MNIKHLLLTLALLFCITPGSRAGLPSKVTPVKNIIVMIPDGTSLSTVSLARWYQRYLNKEQTHLNIDPLLCGTVVTFSSDAPIGDSAPTTSCYMTGMPSQTGFVSTYPVATDHDLIPVDPQRAFRPLATILEAGKWLLNKRSGLVVTCDFTHATPADCSAHSYRRSKREWIAPQMVHLPVDVMMGGGTALITPELKKALREQNITYIEKNPQAMQAFEGEKLWALFDDYALPYDIDRNPSQVPSLAEMTQKALSILNKNNDNGFFLMVEGSKVDWAAHANDPVGLGTEMLAFDRAVKVALDFAQQHGNTALIILSDHGNGGMSIGLQRLKKYDKTPAQELFGHLTSIKRTAEGIAVLLNQAKGDKAKEIFQEYAQISLDEEDIKALHHCESYINSPIPTDQREGTSSERGLYSENLSSVVCAIYKKYLPFGFTSHGHTGEEVLLASYHPQGDRPTGMVLNTEINEYLCRLWGLEGRLPQLTDEAYAPHQEVFASYPVKVSDQEKDDIPLYLEVELPQKKKLRIYPFTPKMEVGTEQEFKRGKARQFTAPNNAVWVDKTETFYLNRNVLSLITTQ